MAASTFILMTEWNSKFTIFILKLRKMQKQQKQLKVLNFTVFFFNRDIHITYNTDITDNTNSN